MSTMHVAEAKKKNTFRASTCSVAVSVRLEGAILLHADVIRLLLRHSRELGTQCWEVQIRNLLIEGLRQQINIVLVSTVLFRVPQEIELTPHLIGERAGH